jgi:hypothetical protein
MSNTQVRIKNTDSLEEARDQLYSLVADGEAVRCPCCDQTAKLYKRKIHSTMARTLILMYKTHGTSYGHMPSLDINTHEGAQLSWWGLIEEDDKTRADGGRAGWWKVSDLGKKFILKQRQVKEYALIYNGTCLDLEGGDVWISDCLAKGFDYRELMRA